MANPVAIIVPSRTEAYVRNLVESINRTQPGFATNPRWRLVLVNSGNEVPAEYCRLLESYYHATVVGLPDPFVFARAVNLGARLAPQGSNLLVVNDDAAFASPRPLEAAERMLDLMDFQRYGLVGAQVVKGVVGNPDQERQVPAGRIAETRRTVCFVAVLVSALAWRAVGPMDESFDGYGFEDNDYSARVIQRGMRLGTTSDIQVEHGLDGRAFSSTYSRDTDQAGMSALIQRARDKFVKKWGSEYPIDYLTVNRPSLQASAGEQEVAQ